MAYDWQSPTYLIIVRRLWEECIRVIYHGWLHLRTRIDRVNLFVGQKASLIKITLHFVSYLIKLLTSTGLVATSAFLVSS